MSEQPDIAKLRADYQAPQWVWDVVDALEDARTERDRLATVRGSLELNTARAEAAEAERDELRKLVNGCACGVSYHYCEVQVEALREAATTPAKYRDDWLAMKRRAEAAEARLKTANEAHSIVMEQLAVAEAEVQELQSAQFLPIDDYVTRAMAAEARIAAALALGDTLTEPCDEHCPIDAVRRALTGGTDG
jgi:hypothetical protein